MKTLQEKIAVMQAFDRGEKIEVMAKPQPLRSWHREWREIGGADHEFDWVHYDYRIAPKQPQKEPREFYVILHGEKPVAIGSGRDGCIIDNDVPIKECRTIRVREVVRDESPANLGAVEHVAMRQPGTRDGGYKFYWTWRSK